MLLIDDSTRFRVAIPMRSREEGSAKICGFVSRFNALAGASGGRMARVGSLLSDGAKELVSNEVQEYLDDQGTDKGESPPGVHALNGCAERGILSVFQTVRAQFEQPGAPRTFWPEAWPPPSIYSIGPQSLRMAVAPATRTSRARRRA